MRNSDECYLSLVELLKDKEEELGGCSYTHYLNREGQVESLLEEIPENKRQELWGTKDPKYFGVLLENGEVVLEVDTIYKTSLTLLPHKAALKIIKIVTTSIFGELVIVSIPETEEELIEEEEEKIDPKTIEDFEKLYGSQLQPEDVIFCIAPEIDDDYNIVRCCIVRVSEEFFKENKCLDGEGSGDNSYAYVDSLIEGKYIPEIGLTEFGELMENIFEANDGQTMEECKSHCESIGLKYSSELEEWYNNLREE